HAGVARQPAGLVCAHRPTAQCRARARDHGRSPARLRTRTRKRSELVVMTRVHRRELACVEWPAIDRIRLRGELACERVGYFDPSPILRAVATQPAAFIDFVRSGLWRAWFVAHRE